MIMYIVLIAVVVVCMMCGGLIVYKKRPRKLKHNYYRDQWADLQKLCGDKACWADAVTRADALLGKALKSRNYKGKSFGEKLVSAQRDLTDNDGVWYGHKLAKKIAEDPNTKLSKTDVQDALFGIRQALQDLGALK